MTNDSLALYRTMLRIRRFEEQLADLVESKKVGTPCHLYIGQEAIAAGGCAALKPTDYVWGNHRSHGHYLAKGGDMRAMMAEILGKADGCAGGRGGSMHLVATEVGILGTVPLVAATIPLAVGAAMAAKMRKDGRISVTFFGDGATEEGHFQESLNLAALYKLPVIFVCENNAYASHMSLQERRAVTYLAGFGKAHGMPSYTYDGNDVHVVQAAVAVAATRARRGEGPTLLEFQTYRWRGHVGHDWNFDVGVRRRDELQEWLPKDPIARCRTKLLAQGTSEAALEALSNEVDAEVKDAIAFAQASPYPDPATLTDHVFAPREVA